MIGPKTLAALDRINRHLHNTVWVGLVFVVVWCFAADLDAQMKIEGPFMIVNSRTIHNVALINFVHHNLDYVVGYLIFACGCLRWLEVRKAPLWSKWITLSSLAAPWIIYSFACAYIGGKFIDFGR